MFRTGKVVAVSEEGADLVRARVALGDSEVDTVGFPAMLGPVAPGDAVVVNTSGIDLGLGTGGVGFLLWNLDGEGPVTAAPGHILKLRYTPWQVPVIAAEAPESPHHETLREVSSIEGMPVVACGLHSQLAGVVAGIRAAAPGARIGYLMTDGGALPLAWSELVRSLEEAGLIDATCTAGHAFGGDFETINVFSGLAALRHLAHVNVAVAGMGPGVAGTATTLGFSGIEQGQLLDATTALGGRAVACVRLSFSDDRSRHEGVSHHSLTALSVAARERSVVAIPALEDHRAELVAAQLRERGIDVRHEVVVVDGSPGLEVLRAEGLDPATMGRPMSLAPEPFLAASAAGIVAARGLGGARPQGDDPG